MYTVTAEYLGRQKYTITVSTGEKKVEREFVEPFFNPLKAARRINSITESLNVEEDIDVTSEAIFDAIVQSLSNKKQRKKRLLSHKKDWIIPILFVVYIVSVLKLCYTEHEKKEKDVLIGEIR